MRDNTASQPADQYDGGVRKTLPFYDLFHDQTISLIEAAVPRPRAWLDTGCGTGTLIQKAATLFPDTAFTLADPSAAMLDIAAGKLSSVRIARHAAGTEQLDLPSGSFDVVTAILAHHYFDAETRRRATANCFRMLAPGGIYITFENTRPITEEGKRIALARWRRVQISQGKTPADADKHLARYGVEYLPISMADHLALLGEAGFAAAEVFWLSGIQAGYYAIK